MKLLDLIKQFGQANYNCGFFNQQSSELTKKYEIEKQKYFKEIVSQLEQQVKPANGGIREKKQAEVRRIMNYFIDNNIKTTFPNGDGGYLIALKEIQNLFNLAQVETDWEHYERCKKGISET